MAKFGKIKKIRYKNKIYQISLGIVKIAVNKKALKLYLLAVFVTLSIVMGAKAISYIDHSVKEFVVSESEYYINELSSSMNIGEARVIGESTQKIIKLTNSVTSGFIPLDKRTYVFDEYIKSRNSPLEGLGYLFTEACDRYGAPRDCLTTIAIARHETDLCKYNTSAEMHNCMGWGGGGEYRIQFNSFEEHINTATDVLVNQYGPKFMIDPRKMEGTFCGPQAECDNWGNRILFFMDEIDAFGEQLGVGRLSDLR